MEDQLAAIRRERADRFEARAPAAAPQPPLAAAVPIEIGLRVKNPSTGRQGQVTSVTASQPGCFGIRFLNGEQAERPISIFQSADGRPLAAADGTDPEVALGPAAKGKAKAKGKPKAKPKAQPGGFLADEDDDENTPVNPARRLTKDLAKEIRLGFVRKVYATLSVQLLITCAIAGPISLQSHVWIQEHRWLMFVAVIGSIMCWITLCCFRQVARRYPWPFLLFFTSVKGILLGFLSAPYTWQSVALALAATSLIFLGMSIYAWTTTTDFTGFAPYFHGALLVFFVFGFILLVMRFFGVHISWLTMIFDVFGVLLFTAMIIFDTQRILGEYGGHQLQFSVDDWAFASIALYRDILHIFRHLLRLTGKRRF